MAKNRIRRNWPDEIESRSGANNPKGIATSSPRLRGTSYLGKRSRQNDNRNAVAAMSRGSCSIELFRDTAEIRVERVARGFVAQKRTTVFGGEDEMNVNGGKGLWHVGRMANRGTVRQREREATAWWNCVTKSNRARVQTIPKGLRPSAQGWRACAYLGFAFGRGNNANGVVAEPKCAGGSAQVATALRLGRFLGR